MPIHFGAPELIILLVIVVVLFGAGRIGRLGGELGTGIREFRRGLNGGADPLVTPPAEPPVVTPTVTTSASDPTANKPL